MESERNSRCLYDILGLQQFASEREIKAAYKKLARLYHPDRVKNMEHNFSEISNAYEVLSDPIRKEKYNASLNNLNSDSNQTKTIEMYKREAQLEVELMERTYEENMLMESQRGGLKIVRAIYGELPLKGYSTGEHCIDVTVPIQCLVVDSQLNMAGEEPKQEYSGIYNPLETMKSPPRMRILYQHGMQLHEVEVGDIEPLHMPLREHALLSYTKELQNHRNKHRNENDLYSPYYIKKRNSRMRKRLILVSIAVGTIAFVVLKRRK